MGYAPVSILATAPDPPNAGVAFDVMPDTGARFPAPPFTAIIFPVQEIPNVNNSEEVTVIAIYNDHFTVVRALEPIALTSGLKISVLSVQTNYDLAESVTLEQEFPLEDTNISLYLATPQGDVGVYTSALEQEATDGGSIFSLAFSANESGQWFYKFLSDQRGFTEQDFFVRFSEVF